MEGSPVLGGKNLENNFDAMAEEKEIDATCQCCLNLGLCRLKERRRARSPWNQRGRHQPDSTDS